MADFTKVPTSREVWAVIHARHRDDLAVFSTISQPHGSWGSDQALMMTQYGFMGSAIPLLEARTTWTINPAKPHERKDETHEYWLIFATDEQVGRLES